MENYTIETVNLEEVLKKENYSFFLRKSENVFDVYSRGGDKKFQFLSLKMGQKSDKLLEKFLIDMVEISRIIISSKDKFYFYMVLLMFVFLEANHENLIQGGYTYCSHAQGFFTFFKESDKIKKYFEKKYQDNYELIKQAYNGYIDAKEEMSLFYKTPKQSVERIKIQAEISILNKEIYFENAILPDSELNGALFKSKFHRMHANEFMKKFNDIDFQLKRFVTIFQYFLLNNLGLTYKERCFLCYSVYRFIEQKYKFNYGVMPINMEEQK